MLNGIRVIVDVVWRDVQFCCEVEFPQAVYAYHTLCLRESLFRQFPGVAAVCHVALAFESLQYFVQTCRAHAPAGKDFLRQAFRVKLTLFFAKLVKRLQDVLLVDGSPECALP